VYYYGCHRKAGDYKWFADNITRPQAMDITAGWLFGTSWYPGEKESIDFKR
jgi:pectinesterase